MDNPKFQLYKSKADSQFYCQLYASTTAMEAGIGSVKRNAPDAQTEYLD